jgi:hypothetical protein
MSDLFVLDGLHSCDTHARVERDLAAQGMAHIDIPARPPDADWLRNFRCPMCGKRFVGRGYLKVLVGVSMNDL